ncbi:TrmH family RNA methyltransferase [Sphingobacterium paludis]|uniref:TrmH family RNA methyltransferase n=1 Tax=Sphingobacterium paludis TaxID=1476465 RepID=A0A4R7DB10_9SPHI|nr:RNA methyltransferase [Sphingobacterium paludis]TDS16276.1 TrmH family RNA methyltransferase [Sphingobacterium paludis]
MLSKAQISLVTSLQHKKFRKQHGLFLVEGIKSVLEFISSNYQIHSIFTTAEAAAKMPNLPQKIKYVEVSAAEFHKISTLTNPQGVLALVHLPEAEAFDWTIVRNEHSLLLDDIQDPGNLGTIIRTAEWFGIRQLICSLGTVDAYNSKVVQATMGSLARIKITYTDLVDFIADAQLPTYGAVLHGESIYKTDFGKAGLIIMGNEGNGISPALLEAVEHAVTIPRVGEAESLNVAIATTIFCSELTRQSLAKK